MAESFKRKTGLAIFWSFVDKGGQQVIQFVFFYILARLVDKSEIGLVAVLAIFTAVANILQESGFSSALIRKRKVLPQEYASVFYFNVTISISIYIILFFSAPLISWLFEEPRLTDISRVLFLSFVFNAFSIIQNVHLVKVMDFKKNTRITLVAGIAAGVIAITMAYFGYGVWSLVAQVVLQSFFRSCLLWLLVKWRPKGKFILMHIKDMSSFSLKLLATSLLNQICNNIFPLIIGKKFDFAPVASYSQGKKLSDVPQSVVSDGLKSVAYPLLANLEDKTQGKKVFRKIVRITSFISFPLACLLIALASPIVSLYLPSDWTDVIPILQILAIGGAFYPLYNLTGSLLQYKGKSGLLLQLEVFRNILLLSSIIFTIQYGVLGLVAGISTVNVICFFVAIYVSGKTILYSLMEVLKDILPYMALAIVTILPFYFLSETDIENIWLLLVIPLIGGSCLYLLLLKILGSVVIEDTIDFIKQSLKKVHV